MDPTNQGGLYDFLLTALEVRKYFYQRLLQEAVGKPFSNGRDADACSQPSYNFRGLFTCLARVIFLLVKKILLSLTYNVQI